MANLQDSILSELKQQHYAHYLWVMLALPDVRAQLLALLALDVELALISSKVSEDMLGHIRFTWWQESFELMEQGKVREHPLLELWYENSLPLMGGGIAHSLITLHREYFEQHPGAGLAHALSISHSFVYGTASEIIKATAPRELAKWQRKVKLIEEYKQKGKLKPTSLWLMARLLVS